MVPLRTAHLLAKRPRADGILLAKRPLSKTALTPNSRQCEITGICPVGANVEVEESRLRQ
jgi:hypothetical protein